MLRLFALVLLAASLATPARAASVTVFAAASLTNAMTDIAALWQRQGGVAVHLSFDSSATLARQLEQGAPADIYASADIKWMDWAEQRGLIEGATRRTLLGNRLVLVMPKARVKQVKLAPGVDLAALLGPGGRLAIGNPQSVPAGIYAQQALVSLGLWASVKGRLATAANVRSALLLVEHAEAPAGIVYATDAAVAPGVAIAGVFPPGSHQPIAYPFAITAHGDTPQARALMAFLAGPEAGRIFRHYGFTTMTPATGRRASPTG